MRHLSIIARVTVPAAMVIFLAHEISRSMAVTGWWRVALLIGAAATAVGIEIVGILAGRTLEGYWRLRDAPRALLALGLLLAYTAAATYILWRNPAIRLTPLIAAIVYVLAALSDGLDATTERQQNDGREERQWQRQMEAAKLRLAHEARLERIRAKAAAQKSQSVAEATQAATLYECSCGKVYDVPQAYSGHTRHCDIYQRAAANGAGQ